MKVKLVVFMASAVAGSLLAADALDNIGTVRLKGRLGEALDRMIENHVCATDVDYITAPFLEKTERHGWWQTEFWGKYMHAAVPYAAYSASLKLSANIKRGVSRILASQEPCGYIGNYPDELRCGEGWDVWGMKYTMMGLLHYYDLVKENSAERERVLSAVKRLCDYVIQEIGPGGKRGCELWQTGNWSGMASSSILEPVIWLYRSVAEADGETAAQKYLDFATYIVKGMREPEAGPRLVDLALKGISVADRNGHGNKAESDGGYVSKNSRWKAYEMMSCYQGILEYVSVMRQRGVRENEEVESLFKAALMTAEDIAKEEINLAGGCASSEAWFHGARKQYLPYMHLQETCVTTTWMRLCEKLLEMTGDPKWADQIERTFYNAYLAALKADGSEFAGYTPLSGNRYHGQHHCYMHTDCCTANGPRGFLCFLKPFFRIEGEGATFNFYASAIVKGELAGGRKVAFDMYSLYPRENFVRIVSHTENVGRMPLRLRVPQWAGEHSTIKLNGEVLAGIKVGNYFMLTHEWRLGDVVEINFETPIIVHDLEQNVAFTYGSILLARDSRLGAGDMTEAIPHGKLHDGEALKGFTPVRTPSDDIWMTFSAVLPIGIHTRNPEGALPEAVTFCDYASAGNTWLRDNYYRTWFPIEHGPWQ